MRLVAVSDTHGCHRQLQLPEGDVLLHAGDVCDRGRAEQAADFFEWIAELDFEHKLVIWGNHDFDMVTGASLFPGQMPSGVTLLDHSAYRVGKIVVWGIPTPASKQEEDWTTIPSDTDILMTHRPPHGILDRSRFRSGEGSKRLAERVREVRPRVHLFGHIHRSYGRKQIDGTTFVNASLYRSSARKLVNDPIVLDLNPCP